MDWKDVDEATDYQLVLQKWLMCRQGLIGLLRTYWNEYGCLLECDAR